MARKPSITPARRTDPHGHRHGEAIYLASDHRSGALISIRRDSTDRLIIEVYRADADVIVRAPIGGVQ